MNDCQQYQSGASLPLDTRPLTSIKAPNGHNIVSMTPLILEEPNVVHVDRLPSEYLFIDEKAKKICELDETGVIEAEIPAPRGPPKINIPKNHADMNMSPETPLIQITHKRECHSRALMSFMNDPRIPHVVIRGLTHHLKMDLGKFSSKHLKDKFPNHPLEIRYQDKQPSDENWDRDGIKRVWQCYSHMSKSTIAKYRVVLKKCCGNGRKGLEMV